MSSKPYSDMSQLQSSLLVARSAKVLCTTVFVSGRDPDEALNNSVLDAASYKGLRGWPSSPNLYYCVVVLAVLEPGALVAGVGFRLFQLPAREAADVGIGVVLGLYKPLLFPENV